MSKDLGWIGPKTISPFYYQGGKPFIDGMDVKELTEKLIARGLMKRPDPLPSEPKQLPNNPPFPIRSAE